MLHWLFWPSVAISLGSVVLVPYLLTRLPADYLLRNRTSTPQHRPLPSWRLLTLVIRNILAAGLFVAGLIMLFTPGQGILTLLASLVLATFPGKRRLCRRVLSTPSVLKTVNKLRARAGQPPLTLTERHAAT